MANSITASIDYLKLLDQAYKMTSLSAVLDVAPDMVREADDAGSFKIATLALVGLGDYVKATGFPVGNVSLSWTTYTYSEDRAREFDIDSMDDLEGAELSFANLAKVFMREYEVPEIDAFRFAKLATGAGTDVASTLSTAANWIDALNTADEALFNAEVPDNNRILFITRVGWNLVTNNGRDQATTQVITDSTVVQIPQTRFYTAITLDPGTDPSLGGYSKASGAEDINFILMDKEACFADAKHQTLRVFDPETNQSKDSWLWQFRLYHDLFIYDQRETGIYVHTKDAVS